MGSDYLTVAKAVDAESIELPTETDGTLLLTTLAAQYPGVTGLKFLNEKTGGMRGVRLADGRFHAPEKDGWGGNIYYCVLNKVEDTKSKLDTGDKEGSGKNKKIENKLNQRCSDLIVLDLPWKTTEGEMREYFEGFGDLVLAQVKKDLKTGQSKGYGFIRYSSFESQIKALGQRHFIQGRWCDVKIPNSKEPEQQSSNASPKIYVGRLTEEITENDLREYFSSFGEVTHVFIPNRPFRGFAFVTFLHADVAQSLCGEDHVIKNTSVIVSDANPKSDSRGDSSRQDDDDDEDVDGMGDVDGASGNLNIPPQLNPALVSAVLSQVVSGLAGVGGMQGQGQGQIQQQKKGGGQSSSPQNNGKTSSPGLGRRAPKRDSQGRLRGN